MTNFVRDTMTTTVEGYSSHPFSCTKQIQIDREWNSLPG
jgi:hypothetical protein